MSGDDTLDKLNKEVDQGTSAETVISELQKMPIKDIVDMCNSMQGHQAKHETSKLGHFRDAHVTNEFGKPNTEAIIFTDAKGSPHSYELPASVREEEHLADIQKKAVEKLDRVQAAADVAKAGRVDTAADHPTAGSSKPVEKPDSGKAADIGRSDRQKLQDELNTQAIPRDQRK